VTTLRVSWGSLNWKALGWFALAFFLLHSVSLQLVRAGGPLAPAWPPIGVAVAALLMMPRTQWSAILLLVAILDLTSNALQGYATWTAVQYGAVNLGETLAVATILGRWRVEPITFGRVRHVSALLVASILASTCGGIVAGLVGSPASLADYGRNFATWMVGDVLGVLLFTPLAVVWVREGRRAVPDTAHPPSTQSTLSHALEVILFGALLVAGAQWCFRGGLVLGAFEAHPYMLTLLLLWASLRLGKRGVTLTLVVIAAVAVVMLYSGVQTALGGTTIVEQLVRVQVYIGLMALTGLFLSAAISEVRDAGDAQRRSAEALVDSERRLRQSQKMEAVGQLAGGIAHDFNNILAAILMQANEARSLEPLHPDAHELLLDVEASAHRAASLTRQLLLFSRQQAMQQRVVDLNDIVRNLARLLRRVLPESVQFQVAYAPAPLVVRADPSMVEQVLMNLVVNARDAMPNGGRLTIETWTVTLEASDLLNSPDAIPGRYAGLQVRDTGGGITNDNLPHLFEPFFTTKEPGKGTGLGLSTVFGIAQQHRGVVRVDTTPGHGATFDFLVPLTSEAITPTEERFLPPSTPTDTRTPATVLIVEDDPAVRRMLRRVLERDGLRVLTAETGREALDEWASYPAIIDLVLTDIVMPGGVSGIELARELRARTPTVRVVFTSGYDPEQGGHGELIETGINFLPKPSSPQQIQRVVRSQLRIVHAPGTLI